MGFLHFLALAFWAISAVNSKPSKLHGRTDSAPNPIGTMYPNNITGTLNSTITVVPIPFAVARSIIPAQYRILTTAYESLLPGFPANNYPLIIRVGIDHDVGMDGVSLVQDFQSVHLTYPFVDLLGDGYSSFQYQEYLFATSTNTVAVSGIAQYGTKPVPATFDPPDEAYGFFNSSSPGKGTDIFLDAYVSGNSTPAVTTRFSPLPELASLYPLSLFVNVTNQPVFTNGKSCDNQIFFFNTTLSEGANDPVAVKGDITVVAPYLPKNSTFENVWGIKVDLAFLENNLVPCGQLKGYHGTGSGD